MPHIVHCKAWNHKVYLTHASQATTFCVRKKPVSCNAQMLPLCYTLLVCLEGFNNTATQSAVTKELRSKALNIPLVSKWSEEFVASCQESQHNGKLETMIHIHFYVVSRELQICCRNCTNPKPDLLITLNLHFVLNTTPPVLICTVPKLTLLFRVGLMLKMQQRMKLAGEWNCRRCCSSQWNCWRMELQRERNRRRCNRRERNLQENGITDTWAENKSAGKWNCECMSREWNCRCKLNLSNLPVIFYSSFSLLLWLQCSWLSTSSTTTTTTSGWPLLQISHFIFLLFVLFCHTHMRGDYQQEKGIELHPWWWLLHKRQTKPHSSCLHSKHTARSPTILTCPAASAAPTPPKSIDKHICKKKFSPEAAEEHCRRW